MAVAEPYSITTSAYIKYNWYYLLCFYVKIGKIQAEFRPKAMVVESKNKKVQIFFYSIPHQDLRQ